MVRAITSSFPPFPLSHPIIVVTTDNLAAGRGSSSRQTSSYAPGQTAFKHISIVQSSEIDQLSATNDDDDLEFIARPSLQTQIANRLEDTQKIASIAVTSVSASQPSTFAEAAMSTQIPRPDRTIDCDSPSKALKSLGSINLVKKKKKIQKWATLDLSTLENLTEAGASSDAPTSRGASPAPTASHTQRWHNFASDEEPPNLQATIVSTDTQFTSQSFTSPDQLALAEETALRSELLSRRDTSGGKLEESTSADSFESIMAHVSGYAKQSQSVGAHEDVFDSITWDPDLPKGPALKPLERIIEKPSKVAYTTVGSVIDASAVPQFLAPQRIQREGAGRRPLGSANNRPFESMFHPRGQSFASNTANSTLYTQFLQQIPATHESLQRQKAQVDHAAVSLPPLTEQEKKVLSKLNEAISKIPVNARKPALTSQISSTSSNSTFPNHEDELRQTLGAPGLLQGLEKMQTLQRLARFENPMREHALSRLSEFAVDVQVNNSTAGSSCLDPQSIHQHNSNWQHDLTRQNLSLPNMQSNPLLCASAKTSTHSVGQGSASTYPKPLTAGPPGMRQFPLHARARYAKPPLPDPVINNASNFRNSSALKSFHNVGVFQDSKFPHVYDNGGSWSIDGGSYYEGFGGYATESYPVPLGLRGAEEGNMLSSLQYRPEAYSQRITANAVAPVDLGPHTPLHDTLTQAQMAKYYPNGLPPLGVHSPLPDTSEDFVYSSLKRRVQQSSSLNQTQLDDFFYYGQRKWKMTSEDHIIELEHRHNHNAFGPIAGPHTSKMITPKEVESLTTAKAAIPLIDGLFGTLLAHAETSEFSRTKMNKWIKASEQYIDNTVEGNKSYFGEDWGKTC